MPDTDLILNHLMSIAKEIGELKKGLSGLSDQFAEARVETARQLAQHREESQAQIAALAGKVTINEGRLNALEQRPAVSTVHVTALDAIIHEQETKAEGKRDRHRLFFDKLFLVAVTPITAGMGAAGVLIAHKLGIG